MGGSDTTTQQQSQNSTSTSAPWDKAQPLLTNILGTLQGQSTAPTTAQTTAAGNLVTAANGAPDLSGAEKSITTGMLGGDPTGLLNSGNTALNSRLGGIADGSTDPMQNPAMRGWLDTITNDVSNSTDGQFAAAGRDMSPANVMAKARGIAQGEAPILASQFNTNVANKMGAANTLYGAGNTTAGAVTGNEAAGLSDAAALPGLLTAPAQGQLNAANTQQQLPLTVVQQLEQLGIPMASLGGTTTGSGTSTGTTTKQSSPISNIMGGLLGAAGLYGKIGNPFGGGSSTPDYGQFGNANIGGYSMPMFSDERLKENIEPVGMLNDGQNVYAYNYKGDNTPQIGLLAQEVERVSPDAVGESHGFKTVNYAKATERARHIGGLLDLKMAA